MPPLLSTARPVMVPVIACAARRPRQRRHEDQCGQQRVWISRARLIGTSCLWFSDLRLRSYGIRSIGIRSIARSGYGLRSTAFPCSASVSWTVDRGPSTVDQLERRLVEHPRARRVARPTTHHVGTGQPVLADVADRRARRRRRGRDHAPGLGRPLEEALDVGGEQRVLRHVRSGLAAGAVRAAAPPAAAA